MLMESTADCKCLQNTKILITMHSALFYYNNDFMADGNSVYTLLPSAMKSLL